MIDSMGLSDEVEFYKREIFASDIPEYWRQTQLENLFVASDFFEYFRYGGFHSYHPLYFEKPDIPLRVLRKMSNISFLPERIRLSIKKLFHMENMKKINRQLDYEISKSFLGMQPASLMMTLGVLLKHFHPSVLRFEDSLVGSPQDVFHFDGGAYTYELVEKQIRALLVDKLVSLSSREAGIVVEIGGSYGLQIELLKKHFPQHKYILIETPSQAFAAWRYLSKSLPSEKLLPAHEISDRNMADISLKGVDASIIILTLSQKDLLARLSDQITLVINQRSFQEMEWKYVDEYLSTMVAVRANDIILWEMSEGHPEIPSSERTTKEKYCNKLSESYVLKYDERDYNLMGSDYDVYHFELRGG